MIKRFIAYYKPHKFLFFADMFAAFLIACSDVVYPIITRNILNIYIPNSQMRSIIYAAIFLLGMYLVKMFLQFFMDYYGHLVGVRMQADMRRDLFMRLEKMPFSFFDENETGTIMSRMVNDLMDLSELAHHGPEDLFFSFAILIGAFIYLCTINVSLTLIIFVFVPIIAIFSIKKRKKMHEAFLESRKKVGVINATLENSLTGIRVAKAFTANEYEEAKFEDGNIGFVKARQKAYKVMAQFFSGNFFIINLLNLTVLIAGSFFIYYGQIGYGDFVAYVMFVNMFITPIRTLTNFVEQFQNGMTGFQRFIEIIDEPIEEDREGAIDLTDIKGEINFENVSFSYSESTEILKDINLKIEPGQTLALVGPSGGGKTTLCHLIPHFYRITEGDIKIDGTSIKDIKLESLRKSIGIVQQDVFLFNGTIRENILYGKLDATEEEVIEAAKRANIYDYVQTLEEGFDTNIGERGVKLSGGQKQRLSIARVFLKNPPILVLDEATSALDNTTELLIQGALNELCKGRTTIVVAHRLSTIKNADEIAVVIHGKIEEKGSHDKLMEKENGIYKQLYDAQFSPSENHVFGFAD